MIWVTMVNQNPCPMIPTRRSGIISERSPCYMSSTLCYTRCGTEESPLANWHHGYMSSSSMLTSSLSEGEGFLQDKLSVDMTIQSSNREKHSRTWWFSSFDSWWVGKVTWARLQGRCGDAFAEPSYQLVFKGGIRGPACWAGWMTAIWTTLTRSQFWPHEVLGYIFFQIL